MAETDTGMIVDHPLAVRVQRERDDLADLVGDLERVRYITDSFLLMKHGDATYVPDFEKNPEFGQMKGDIVRITDKIQARIETLGQLNREIKDISRCRTVVIGTAHLPEKARRGRESDSPTRGRRPSATARR